MRKKEGHLFGMKDLVTDNDIRWCPGCGDFAILKQVQMVLPEFGIPKEKIVFVSGIGCSSRFPYYMNTYGMHSIHGRATAIATGLKVANPDLNVWIVTGDGDGLSIGGNHLIHLLRRNPDVNILLFNNQIYGLTKGQYSPTSEQQKITKSSPTGSIEQPFNPLSLAMGADASFIARTADKEAKHLQQILRRAQQHKGSSFVEIYQNCLIFNDGAFDQYTDRKTRKQSAIFLEHGQPITFDDGNKGLVLDGYTAKVVSMDSGEYSLDDLWVHDELDELKAHILCRFFDTTAQYADMPRPFGVIFARERACYEDILEEQMTAAQSQESSLDQLLAGPQTWTIE